MKYVCNHQETESRLLDWARGKQLLFAKILLLASQPVQGRKELERSSARSAI